MIVFISALHINKFYKINKQEGNESLPGSMLNLLSKGAMSKTDFICFIQC